MADPTPPTASVPVAETPGASAPDEASAQSEFMAQSEPGLMTAGAPGWYSLLATSFLVCEFNPIGAIGLAAGAGSAANSPLEWALTAASFMLALSGFIYAEWRASIDRNQRALEISSVIAIAAGIIPCISAISMPAFIVWPIGMMFLITGGSGLRASRKLTASADEQNESPPAAPESSPHAATEAPATPNPKRRRKRRRSRRKNRRPATRD